MNKNLKILFFLNINYYISHMFRLSETTRICVGQSIVARRLSEWQPTFEKKLSHHGKYSVNVQYFGLLSNMLCNKRAYSVNRRDTILCCAFGLHFENSPEIAKDHQNLGVGGSLGQCFRKLISNSDICNKFFFTFATHPVFENLCVVL